MLTANTDDHLRNHGFLREGRAWILSPAYDLNPNPYSTGVQSTSPGIGDATASVELACSVAGYYRLTLDRAKEIVAEIESSTAQWRTVAAHSGRVVRRLSSWRRRTKVSRLSMLVVSSRPGNLEVRWWHRNSGLPIGETDVVARMDQRVRTELCT